MRFKRSKRREQERTEATAARMRGLTARRSYEWADPTEVDKQVRNRTDAANRASARKEQGTPAT